MRKYISLVESGGMINEKIIIRGEAVSDVDGRMHQVAIHANPSREETEALLRNSIEGEIRGFIQDTDGVLRRGTVVVWDAYLADHGGVETLLRDHGYGSIWPRFSFNRTEFAAGLVRNYIDSGATEDDWAAFPTRRLARMLGREPTFKPT